MFSGFSSSWCCCLKLKDKYADVEIRRRDKVYTSAEITRSCRCWLSYTFITGVDNLQKLETSNPSTHQTIQEIIFYIRRDSVVIGGQKRRWPIFRVQYQLLFNCVFFFWPVTLGLRLEWTWKTEFPNLKKNTYVIVFLYTCLFIVFTIYR